MSRCFRNAVVLFALAEVAMGGGCMRPLFMSGPLEMMSAQAHRNAKRARRDAERNAREDERAAKAEAAAEAKAAAAAKAKAPTPAEQLQLGPLTESDDDLLNVRDPTVHDSMVRGSTVGGAVTASGGARSPSGIVSRANQAPPSATLPASYSPAERVATDEDEDATLPSANEITAMLGERPTAEIGGHPKAERRLDTALDDEAGVPGYTSLGDSADGIAASYSSTPGKAAPYRPGSTSSNPYEQLSTPSGQTAR